MFGNLGQQLLEILAVLGTHILKLYYTNERRFLTNLNPVFHCTAKQFYFPRKFYFPRLSIYFFQRFIRRSIEDSRLHMYVPYTYTSDLNNTYIGTIDFAQWVLGIEYLTCILKASQ